MGNLFKGWRRKAGCVLLVMTCGFLVDWMRSYTFCRFSEWEEEGRVTQLTVVNGGISWAKYVFSKDSRTFKDNRSLGYHFGRYNGCRNGTHGWWSFNTTPIAGFRFGTDFRSLDRNIEERADYWLVPYWSVVLPLTLLSAYLILGKPRMRAAT